MLFFCFCFLQIIKDVIKEHYTASVYVGVGRGVVNYWTTM